MASYSSFDVGGTQLDVHKAPEDGKPHLATKIIYSGRSISYVSGGKMFSTRVGSGKWYYGKRWSGRLDIIKDAIALGMLPKKANAERVAKIEEARKQKQTQAWAAKSALDSMAKAGVLLTPAQVKTLKRKARAA